MRGRTIALAVAVCGWGAVGLFVFALVYQVGFLAVGVIGLLLWFACVHLEIQKDGAGWVTPEQVARQYGAREHMAHAERASRHHEHLVAIKSVRFFKYLGIGLTAIGAAGFLYFQL
jgi:hypothetical protein